MSPSRAKRRSYSPTASAKVKSGGAGLVRHPRLISYCDWGRRDTAREAERNGTAAGRASRRWTTIGCTGGSPAITIENAFARHKKNRPMGASIGLSAMARPARLDDPATWRLGARAVRRVSCSRCTGSRSVEPRGASDRSRCRSCRSSRSRPHRSSRSSPRSS